MNKILNILCSAALIVATACSSSVKIDGQLDEDISIYPDYKDVDIPCNIAPLNFSVDSASGTYALQLEANGSTLTVKAKDGDFDIPERKWRTLMAAAAGDSIKATVAKEIDGKWMAYKPFGIRVEKDSINKMLVYRRLPPLYGLWMNMGIYQRDLQTYEETPIYTNDYNDGNCVNCHSFCNRSADRMMFHMRVTNGGTYIMRDGEKIRLDSKFDADRPTLTYPYWHPSGRFIAYSVNSIFQVFHTSDPNRVEVCDDASDIVVYDIDTNEAFTSPLLESKSSLETFPAFSPDGRTLYFCSAPAPEAMPQDYKDVRYSLCAIAFDPDTRQFGSTVDTLFNSAERGLSLSFPRPSPDGRWLVATVHGYGNFSIWHKDADLWIMDLASGDWHALDAANSPDVDSYHSWSTNSRWLAFSSRRDDGLYTRPYFAYIDENGHASKPFMLPQRHPRQYYRDMMDSYNIPEFAAEPIDLTPAEACAWSRQPAKKINH